MEREQHRIVAHNNGQPNNIIFHELMTIVWLKHPEACDFDCVRWPLAVDVDADAYKIYMKTYTECECVMQIDAFTTNKQSLDTSFICV